MPLALRVGLAALALLLLAGSCGGGPPPPAADLTVDMRDFSVSSTKTTFAAGRQTILVRNRGGSPHELTIIKTDLAPDKLPVEGSRAKEDGMVAASEVTNPGGSTTLTVDLAPGKYVFICNQPGHYPLGMRIAVTVQ